MCSPSHHKQKYHLNISVIDKDQCSDGILLGVKINKADLEKAQFDFLFMLSEVL